jgi:hypothetical protein
MEMASTKATLVDIGDFPDSVTATIPRADFESALTSEDSAELFLEVTRPEGGDKSEKRDVSVAWSRADLERLLAETTGPAIKLAFDRDELERVLVESEVDAHSLRDKAVILAVAAATATVGASTAAATTPDESTLGARGITPSYLAVHDEATLAARGIKPTAAATHDEATLAARGIEPTAAATHDEATLAARGIEPGTLPATHDEATLAARGIEPATPADDGGWAIDVPTPDASTAAKVGGAAGLGLLITAAGFAVRRQRDVHPG